MGFLNVCASDMFVIQRACRGDILRDSVTSQAVVAEGKTMFVWGSEGEEMEQTYKTERSIFLNGLSKQLQYGNLPEPRG